MQDLANVEQMGVKTARKMGNTYCPGCGSPNLEDFFEVERIPVHVCLLGDSAEEARQASMGDIKLTYCTDCGFAHNRIFDVTKLSFKPGYEASLIHSKVFRTYLEGVASRLIERYNLRDKTVLEIGCGAGEFLRLVCRMGGNKGIGIDPTVRQEGTEQVGKGTVTLIRDFYTRKYADIDCDFICCLSVFEDFPAPVDFLKSLRETIGEREIPIYFEVYNAAHAFRSQETWAIHYEQCNYFSPECYPQLFEKCGFEILDTDTCYEDNQYLYVEAGPAENSRPAVEKNSPRPGNLPKEIADFSQHHRRKVALWKARLQPLRTEGKRVVAWGSGGKGISFLNVLKAEDLIKYVVDINPNRQGKYVPGSAQMIVAPEFLVEFRPEIIILTNPLYEREIKKQVTSLGLSCEFMLA